MTSDWGIGIDLNGLSDAAAFDLGKTDVMGGEVPSVVIPSEDKKGAISIIAGKEATLAIDGRGWVWPKSAQRSARIPLDVIINQLKEDRDLDTSAGPIPAAQMMAASIEALASARGPIGDRLVVLSIPDDGRFNDDVQQSLLNALVPSGFKVQLLWRSVAAILGASKDLNPIAQRLAGQTVAVISLMNDGLGVSRMIMTQRGMGEPYVVPKRDSAGRIFLFDESILRVAERQANRTMAPFGEDGWQVLWGDGLALRWMLRLDDKPALVQTANGWTKIDGAAPADLQNLHVSDRVLDDLDHFLEDVRYIIYEGPALEAPCDGTRLLYRVQTYLERGRFHANTGERRHSLILRGLESHLVARGCVEYARRRAVDEMTYLDHLPQIRLAVRDDDNAAKFIPLIPENEECEGGKAFNKKIDLEFKIAGGADTVKFYVLREGNAAPRLASEQLRTVPSSALPIQMHVHQIPAQGRARLTIEAMDSNTRFQPIEVNWSRMEVLEGISEQDIIDRLETAGVKVPPVQPHSCHPFLWVLKDPNDLLSMSLADHVDTLADKLRGPLNDTVIDEIKATRLILDDYKSPSSATRGWGSDRHPETLVHRAISSDGELPDPEEGLHKDTLEKFDHILSSLDGLVSDEGISEKAHNQIVIFGAWCFLRCPPKIRNDLLTNERWVEGRNVTPGFNAMGRCLTKEHEVRAFFSVLEKHTEKHGGVFKNYHANGLFYLLSLREQAPTWMSETQARVFAKAAASRIDELMSQRNYKLVMRTCLRALGGLIRFRAVNAAYLSIDEFLGHRVEALIKRVVALTRDRPDRAVACRIANGVLSALQDRGAPDFILQWEPDDADL